MESEESDISLGDQSVLDVVVEEEESPETIVVTSMNAGGSAPISFPHENSPVVCDAVKGLLKEENILGTARGQAAARVLKLLLTSLESGNPEACHFGDFITAKLSQLLEKSKRALPSAMMGKVWSSYHRFRFDPRVATKWMKLLDSLRTGEVEEAELACQLLMDRSLKKLIANHEEATRVNAATFMGVLTMRERNAIRYMAGYVVMKLKKKFVKKAASRSVQKKRDFFVRVLDGMKAEGQIETIESLEDYTRIWVELIDRGGLYRINDEVQTIMEKIEMVTRQHLNTSNGPPSDSLHTTIKSDVFQARDIMETWDQLACRIPPGYESYSLELLGEVVHLWINIRGHSFAKGWSEKFQKSFKKGTRKTLNRKGTDKDQP